MLRMQDFQRRFDTWPRKQECRRRFIYGQLSEPVHVTQVDLGLPDIQGIVKLPAQCIVEEEYTCSGPELDTGPETNGGITAALILQVLLIITPVEKNEECRIPFKKESGFDPAQPRARILRQRDPLLSCGQR